MVDSYSYNKYLKAQIKCIAFGLSLFSFILYNHNLSLKYYSNLALSAHYKSRPLSMDHRLWTMDYKP